MDASWWNRRVYGAERDDPDPGPRPDHVYVELVGGPLDGLLLDVTGWPTQEVVEGAMLMSDHGAFGPGGRSDYEPSGATRRPAHSRESGPYGAGRSGLPADSAAAGSAVGHGRLTRCRVLRR